MIDALIQYGLALGLTLLVEVPLGVLWLRQKGAFLSCLGINLLTNPLLNLALSALVFYTPLRPTFYLLLAGEALVVLSEAGLYKLAQEVTWRKAFLLSFCLNALSCSLGLLLIQGSRVWLSI